MSPADWGFTVTDGADSTDLIPYPYTPAPLAHRTFTTYAGRLIRDHHIPQARIAVAINRSTRWLTYVLAREWRPTLRCVEVLAELFGVEESDLLDDEGYLRI